MTIKSDTNYFSWNEIFIYILFSKKYLQSYVQRQGVSIGENRRYERKGTATATLILPSSDDSALTTFRPAAGIGQSVSQFFEVLCSDWTFCTVPESRTHIFRFKMKPKGKVYNYFKENQENGKVVYICQFCNMCYKNRNATRMAKHLVKNCRKCPEIIKASLRKRNESLADVTNFSTSTRSPTANFGHNVMELMEEEHDENACVDNVEKFDEKNTQRALARAIYVSGQPLSLVEHPLWKEVFKQLKPDFCLPTRKALATSLLDEEYSKIHHDIDEKIEQAKVIHLAADGWTNIRNEPIINIIVYTPTPYFYVFIETKNKRHTAEYLFEEMCKIIDKIGSEKVLVITTDNAANMVKCGKLLQNKYINIKWTGCLAHILNLIIGDIIKNDNVKNWLSDVTDVIKCIQNSNILMADFKSIAKDKAITKSLHLPVKTRWGSYLYCVESFLECKVVLQNIALNSTDSRIAKFKNLLLDENMWCKLEVLKDFFKPIVDWIVKLEGDYCSIHLVHRAFSELDEFLQKSIGAEILGQEFYKNLKEKFENRKATALKPIHYAATLLDPQNRGATLTCGESIDGWELIMNLGENQCLSIEKLLKEISDFKRGEGLWSKDFIWQMANKVSPVAWWELLYSKTHLGAIATTILTAPATSATVERSFSTFSNIHTKKRNKLDADRAGKICFIAHNWRIMNKRNQEINQDTSHTHTQTTSTSRVNDEEPCCSNMETETRSPSRVNDEEHYCSNTETDSTSATEGEEIDPLADSLN